MTSVKLKSITKNTMEETTLRGSCKALANTMCIFTYVFILLLSKLISVIKFWVMLRSSGCELMNQHQREVQCTGDEWDWTSLTQNAVTLLFDSVRPALCVLLCAAGFHTPCQNFHGRKNERGHYYKRVHLLYSKCFTRLQWRDNQCIWYWELQEHIVKAGLLSGDPIKNL